MDVFSRQNDAFNGSFTSDGATITFPQFGLTGSTSAISALAGNAAASAAGGAGLLVQNLSTNYAQVITKVYELGTAYVYYIGGRSTGGMGMSRIIGPRPIQIGFYSKFGDVCDAATNNLDITVKTGCPTTEGGGADVSPSVYSMKYAVIQQLSMQVNAQDTIINEAIQLIFGSLTLTDSYGNSNSTTSGTSSTDDDEDVEPDVETPTESTLSGTIG